MKYYVFGKYPLELAINPNVASFITDSIGNVYYVNDKFERELLVDTILITDELLENLSQIQYQKLYYTTIINELVKLGYVIKDSGK